MYQGYQRLKFHRDGSILTIALSNPTARNAVDADMHAELARVFLEVALDTDTRVVVLTGDPDGKAFCAGGDHFPADEIRRRRIDARMRGGLEMQPDGERHPDVHGELDAEQHGGQERDDESGGIVAGGADGPSDVGDLIISTETTSSTPARADTGSLRRGAPREAPSPRRQGRRRCR